MQERMKCVHGAAHRKLQVACKNPVSGFHLYLFDILFLFLKSFKCGNEWTISFKI